MTTKIEDLSGRNLGIEDILRYATVRIDVLAILYKGGDYAKKVLLQLQGRGTLFKLNPHSLYIGPTFIRKGEDITKYLQNPGTSPDNTLVICDDVIEGVKHTFGRTRDHLKHFGYNFDDDNPPHFGAIECVIDYQEFGYTSTSGVDHNQIRLVRNF